MKNGVLVLGGIAAIAIAVFTQLRGNIKDFSDKVSVSISSFKLPSVSQGIATVPLTLMINNPTSLGATLNAMTVSISLSISGSSFVEIGTATLKNAFALPPHSKVPLQLATLINLSNIKSILTQKSLFDIIDTVIKSKNVGTLRINYVGKVDSIPISGSETKQVNVPNF